VEERPDLILHVVEAAALDRMLPLTFQLLEAGFPVILVLNMMDECERLGLSVDVDALSARLGIPVVATVAATGQGVDQLKQEVANGGRPILEPASCTPLRPACGRGSRGGGPGPGRRVRPRAPEHPALAPAGG